MSKKHFKEKRDKGILARAVFGLYRIRSPRLRRSILNFLRRHLGTNVEFFSVTLRDIFREYHGVEIGMYSHGCCFTPGALPSGTNVGRYCSLARTASVHNANHPLDFKSTSAIFFNPSIGYVERDMVKRTRLTIGNDVWFGHNATILAGCQSIGDGAVVAAGAIVNRDVPPYGIMVGDPARVVGYRFPEEKIAGLLEEKWWNLEIGELAGKIGEYSRPYGNDGDSAKT